MENIGGLLLACGEIITTKMLASKAINGRYSEVASIVASFILVLIDNLTYRQYFFLIVSEFFVFVAKGQANFM